MTEAEWLSCADPAPMLESLRDKTSERRLRLFAVACARLVWEHVPADTRPAVEVAERCADGEEDPTALVPYRRQMYDPWVNRVGPSQPVSKSEGLARIAAGGTCHPLERLGRSLWLHTVRHLRLPAPGLIRDIRGNPFRPITADPRWRSPAASELAEAIYCERAFDRLPVLADALEEAGCDNTDVLSHCRGDGPHARGCWVIDLLLGKG